MLLTYINSSLKKFFGVEPRIYKELSLNIAEYGDKGANWTIARDKLNKNTKIYSFGIGDNLSFEEELVKNFDLKVYAFDPTPKSLAWIKKQKFSTNIEIYPFGISNKDGIAYFEPPKKENYISFRMSNKNEKLVKLPVYKLSTILKKLKEKKIDVLKLDIEGAEYRVIPEILRTKMDIKQILVEFHHRFSGFTKRDTEKVVSKLRKAGYKLYHISSSSQEYSFINSKFI